jgi:molybdenum cofactor biosynthesis enzyme MoaA
MCFYADDMAQKQPDLTFEEIKKISETAGEFKRLWLSGGEPTLREDLPEIIEMFYRNNHITDVNLPSNGILGDRIVDWIKQIRQNCPDCNISISISLDGFGATHDTQRGVESFYKAASTLKKIDDNFKDDGHVLKNIGTVITKYNVQEVLDFVAWVYGRFNVSTHTIEAARGNTREDGMKVLTEKSLREIQDQIAPYYLGNTDPDWKYTWGIGGYCFNDSFPYDGNPHKQFLDFVKKDRRPALFLAACERIESYAAEATEEAAVNE